MEAWEVKLPVRLWHLCTWEKPNWCFSGYVIRPLPFWRCTFPTLSSIRTTRRSWSNGSPTLGKFLLIIFFTHKMFICLYQGVLRLNLIRNSRICATKYLTTTKIYKVRVLLIYVFVVCKKKKHVKWRVARKPFLFFCSLVQVFACRSKGCQKELVVLLPSENRLFHK